MGYILNRTIEIVRKDGLAGLLPKIRNRLIFNYLNMPFSFYYAMRIKAMKFSRDVQGLVDFVFTGFHGFIEPFQDRFEIVEMLILVKEQRPKAILEIGTARGGTLFILAKIASEDAKIVSIDIPQGIFGGGYPIWKTPLYKSFAMPRQEIHLIRKDSHDIKTLQKVKDAVGDRQLDLLFIDGDHTYAGVKKDFELYAPIVGKGGMIILHDIVIHPLETGCDVHSFWEEVKTRYRYKEIITDPKQNKYGIGVLYVD